MSKQNALPHGNKSDDEARARRAGPSPSTVKDPENSGPKLVMPPVSDPPGGQVQTGMPDSPDKHKPGRRG